MSERILVVGLGSRSVAVADALRAVGLRALEAAVPEDVDGVGFAGVVARGCGRWFGLLRASGRPGLRVAFTTDPASVRHADLVLSDEAVPSAIAEAVRAALPTPAVGGWWIGERFVDLGARRVGDEALGPQEAGLLAVLLAADGAVVSTERLLREVWGISGAAATRAVDHAAHRLRQVLEASPSEPRHLRTVRGEGLALLGARRVGPTGGASDVGVAEPRAVGLDRLAPALDAAIGAGRVVLVGPPGAGKGLMARAWARGRGVRVVRAGGVVDVRGPVVVTAVVPIEGWVAVALPDRTPDLAEIAAHTSLSLGVEPPSAVDLAALVARVGPNPLAVVRFVERAAWVPVDELLGRLDAGALDVLGSLADTWSAGAGALPAPVRAAWSGWACDGAPPDTEMSRLLVGAGFAVWDGGRLRPWPALAAWERAAKST